MAVDAVLLDRHPEHGTGAGTVNVAALSKDLLTPRFAGKPCNDAGFNSTEVGNEELGTFPWNKGGTDKLAERIRDILIQKLNCIEVAGAHQPTGLLQVGQMILRQVLHLDKATGPAARSVSTIELEHPTGDDDYINQDENGDLRYRRAQLEKLQNEVVDLEEMDSGISIMDLGLNEFRMDLLAYMKEHPSLDHTPFGINAVVRGEKPGVIFILKNINPGVNIENQNRLHPFYMVYIGDDGEVVCNHLDPKATLDRMRHLCRGKTEPDLSVCHAFNDETKDGKDMRRISELLRQAVASIIDVKEESDIDSFFGSGQTTFLSGDVRGLDDFELICFLVVMSE